MCAKRVFQSRTDKLCALVASDGSEDSAAGELFDFYTEKTCVSTRNAPSCLPAQPLCDWHYWHTRDLKPAVWFSSDTVDEDHLPIKSIKRHIFGLAAQRSVDFLH